jgi:hypothetical protein
MENQLFVPEKSVKISTVLLWRFIYSW